MDELAGARIEKILIRSGLFNLQFDLAQGAHANGTTFKPKFL